MTYCLVCDILVTEKLRRHWILDQNQNMIYNSGSLEACLTALTELGVGEVKALVGNTEVTILIHRKLTRKEVELWQR